MEFDRHLTLDLSILFFFVYFFANIIDISAFRPSFFV